MRPPFGVAVAAEIHDRIIEATGGAPGVRDSDTLASALAAPFQSFGAADVYPGLVPKAAALTRGIVRGHPFVDGNKRTAFVLLVTFLRLHRRRLVARDADIEDTLVAVASGSMTLEGLTEWLERHVSR